MNFRPRHFFPERREVKVLKDVCGGTDEHELVAKEFSIFEILLPCLGGEEIADGIQLVAEAARRSVAKPTRQETVRHAPAFAQLAQGARAQRFGDRIRTSINQVVELAVPHLKVRAAQDAI